MAAYYNEIDPFGAQWLRNLIAADHIAPGDVDERSIRDVAPSDLIGYTQCHFFAGIGGWSYALRLAGWGDERPVWTGSCPCQPFSEAGKKAGESDERHLWPEFYRLIRASNPPILFGEQVASQDGLHWADGVASDLESSGYAFGAAVLPAVAVGAPHKRNRLFFAAHAGSTDPGGRDSDLRGNQSPQPLARPWAYANWQGGLSGAFRLDDGIPAKLAKRIAHGFGNAIVPQLAAEFVMASVRIDSRGANG